VAVFFKPTVGEFRKAELLPTRTVEESRESELPPRARDMQPSRTVEESRSARLLPTRTAEESCPAWLPLAHRSTLICLKPSKDFILYDLDFLSFGFFY